MSAVAAAGATLAFVVAALRLALDAEIAALRIADYAGEVAEQEAGIGVNAAGLTVQAGQG